MNTSFRSAVAVAAITIAGLLPASGFAYLSPDQVFGNGAAVTPPPTAREGSDAVAARQEISAQNRSEAQQALSPVDAPPKDDYRAPAPEAQPLGLFDPSKQYETRMQRIEEQQTHGSAPTIIIGNDGSTSVIDSRGNVLHSGAPISQTGPGTVLALASLVLAGLSTMAFAAWRSRMAAFQIS